MSAVSIKIGLWFVVIVILFGVTQVQVLNALFMFAAAGVIPGTNISLSPEATMYVVAAWLMLAVALLFRSYIVRNRHRPELERLIQEHQTIVSKQPEAVVVRPRLRQRIAALGALLRTHIAASARELYGELRSFKRPLVSRLRKVWPALVKAVVIIRRRSPVMIAKIHSQIVVFDKAIHARALAFGWWLLQARLYIDRWFK